MEVAIIHRYAHQAGHCVAAVRLEEANVLWSFPSTPQPTALHRVLDNVYSMTWRSTKDSSSQCPCCKYTFAARCHIRRRESLIIALNVGRLVESWLKLLKRAVFSVDYLSTAQFHVLEERAGQAALKSVLCTSMATPECRHIFYHARV